MARKRSTSFRLLKEHIQDPAEALKANHRLEERQLADDPENKRLFAGQAYTGPPPWVSFFNPEDRAQFEGLYGAQAAAILFVLVTLPVAEPAGDEEAAAMEQSRWIAVCFGMAFQDLQPEALESQFGLKVALNRLGRQHIKSLDTRRPEDATIQTRSQNSRTGEIFDFGVDTNHIILQAITGKSGNADFGGTLTGSDGLKLSCDANYTTIDGKAADVVEAYGGTAYQALFPWYGKITPVRDRTQIEMLDAGLVQRLRVRQLDGIHLAPPEIVDYQDIDVFTFTGNARDNPGHDELRITDYLSRFDEDHPVTLADLKQHKVRVASGDGRFFDKWSVYKCISAEIHLDGLLFVLAGDEWYAVVRDFVDRVNNTIAEIPLSTIALPLYRAGETEGIYNERAVQESQGLHFFDKALVRFQGERGPVEFCDLLSEDRQIIHVKRRNRSSQLSHLFMQGYVAAEAFVDYRPLRTQIRDRVPALEHLVPEDDPIPSEYEIVYALLHEGQDALPFFSKVALTSIYKQLRRMHFRVGLTWVGTDAV